MLVLVEVASAGMMYEVLLFDMNALGDIPDKDFTSRAALAGRSPGGGTEGRGQRQKPAFLLSPDSRHLQGGRDPVTSVFRPLGSEPCISYPHSQGGLTPLKSVRICLGAKKAEAPVPASAPSRAAVMVESLGARVPELGQSCF